LRIGSRIRVGVTALQWAIIGIAALLVVAGILLVSDLGVGRMRGYGMAFYPFLPFGFGLFWAFWILLLIAIPIVVLSTRGRGERAGAPQQDEAIRILRERYAKGEITKEQFDQMTRDLSQNR
jgi:putative membrane protein